MTMGTLRERAKQLKEKRPGYGPILDFFVQVRDAQVASRSAVRVEPVKVKKSGTSEGQSLVEKEHLTIDMDASIHLFRSLCRIGRTGNPYMAAELEKIDRALADNTLELQELLAGGGKEQVIERAAADQGLDKQILSFFIQSSTKPSIEAGRDQLRGEVDLESWRKGHCPICGSLPVVSLLKGEGGMRYSVCSYCGCKWRIDRLSCSICGTKEQGMLQYIYGEGEEACRIDLCDNCHHFIKTIDYRSLEGSDPSLEDLATIHLDMVAVQKGYTRVIPNPWTT
jgi:FdhE protein